MENRYPCDSRESLVSEPVEPERASILYGYQDSFGNTRLPYLLHLLEEEDEKEMEGHHHYNHRKRKNEPLENNQPKRNQYNRDKSMFTTENKNNK